MNARKPQVGGRKPHLCSQPLGSSFDPSSLLPVGIHYLLLSNLTTELHSTSLYLPSSSKYKWKLTTVWQAMQQGTKCTNNCPK